VLQVTNQAPSHPPPAACPILASLHTATSQAVSTRGCITVRLHHSLSHPGKPPRKATPQLSSAKGCCAPFSFHPQPNPKLTLPQATADFCTYELLRTTMAQLTHDDELDLVEDSLGHQQAQLGLEHSSIGQPAASI